MSVLVNFRVDDSLKRDFEQLCAGQGKNMTSAFIAFMNRAVKLNRIPAESLDEMSYGEAVELAELGNDMQILATLGRHSDWRIRDAVARNKNSSPQLLDVLGYDERPEVRFSVLLNPKTQISTIERLLDDNDETVRKWAQAGLGVRTKETAQEDAR